MLYLLAVLLYSALNVKSLTMIPTSRIFSVKLGDRIHVEIKDDMEHKLFSDDGKDHQGVDMRNPALSDLDIEELYDIGVNMKKKSLLNTLEDDKVGLPRKIKMIEDFGVFDSSMKSDVRAGGLLDDWDFEEF